MAVLTTSRVSVVTQDGTIALQSSAPVVTQVGPPGVQGPTGEQGNAGQIVVGVVVQGEEPSFTAGASSFTIARSDAIASTLCVHIGGVRIERAFYTLAGNTVSLVGMTLSAGDELSVDYEYQTTAGVDETYVLSLASRAAKTLFYTAGVLTSIAFVDGGGVTNHGMTLAYTDGVLTSTVESFLYAAQTWTITTTLSYAGDGSLQTVTPVLTRT